MNKKFLWIMSRETELSEEDDLNIREKLVEQGNDISKIVNIPKIWE